MAHTGSTGSDRAIVIILVKSASELGVTPMFFVVGHDDQGGEVRWERTIARRSWQSPEQKQVEKLVQRAELKELSHGPLGAADWRALAVPAIVSFPFPSLNLASAFSLSSPLHCLLYFGSSLNHSGIRWTMPSQTEAVTTAHEHSSSPSPPPNGAAPNEESPKRARRSKYRHVAAYHSELRHSSLSRDSTETPNFLGFRNLMVLVLGRDSSSAQICGRADAS